MERGSDVHSPRLDEQMQRQTESITRGKSSEARAEEFREMEEAHDEILAGALRQEAVRERSELARHLRGSIFPAARSAVVQCAIDEHAPDDMLVALRGLPEDEVFLNAEAVWEALGGARERRTHDASVTEPRTVYAADLEAFCVDETEGVPRGDVPQDADDDDVERVEEFRFRFDLVHRLAAAAFLVSPATASVVIDRSRGVFVARFGPWSVETSLRNVEWATATGPYHTVKTIGPPHVSFADRGLTFATNDQRGLCIRFQAPVRGIDPLGVVRHPALTVTVDDVAGLRAALSS